MLLLSFQNRVLAIGSVNAARPALPARPSASAVALKNQKVLVLFALLAVRTASDNNSQILTPLLFTEPRPGDWVCPGEDCGKTVFAGRRECFACQTPRPEGIEDGEGGENFEFLFKFRV